MLESLRHDLGKRREAAGVTLSDVGRIAKLGDSTIWRFENGGKDLGDNFYAILLAYALALQTDPQELLGSAVASFQEECATAMAALEQAHRQRQAAFAD